MVSLFPALIVTAAVIGLLPDTAPLRFQLAVFFDRILPSDVSPILQSYFVDAPHNAQSGRVLTVAAFVSITGAASVMAKIMEGLRRAHGLPPDCWTPWSRILRAYLLVPLSVLPFLITSALVVFGHIVVIWLALHVMPAARVPVYLLALVIRWLAALTASIGLISLLFHIGTPMKQPWKRTLPGATAATVLWFFLYPCIRLVCYPLCQLLSGLRFPWSRYCFALLALPYCFEHSLRCGDQRSIR